MKCDVDRALLRANLALTPVERLKRERDRSGRLPHGVVTMKNGCHESNYHGMVQP